jgi:hypothetical protein
MTVRNGRRDHRTLLAGLVLLLLGCSPLSASEPMPQKGYGIGDGGRGLVPGRDYVPAQVIVGLRQAASPGEAPNYTPPAGGRIAGVMQGTAIVIQFPSEEAAQRAIPVLLADPRLSFVERNGIMRIPPMPPPPTKGSTPQ